MATTVGEIFSMTEKIVAQHDKVAVGDMAETLVIEFDQDKFEELLSSGNTSHVTLRKHRKVTLAKREPHSVPEVVVNSDNTSDSKSLNFSVLTINLEVSKPIISSERTRIVFDKTNSTSNFVAKTEAFSKANALASKAKGRNVGDKLPMLKSVSHETSQTFSKSIRNSVSPCPKNKGKLISFPKSRSMAWKVKNNGKNLFLSEILISCSKAETTPVGAQLAVNGEAAEDAQLASNGEANRFQLKPDNGSVSVPQGTNMSDKQRGNPLKRNPIQDRLGPRNFDSLEPNNVEDLR